jgi:transcription elongation factor Elf1
MEKLQQKLIYANKKVSFAWGKYYEQMNLQLDEAHTRVETYNRMTEDVCIPTHIKDEIKEMATALQKKWNCPICLDMIESKELEITNCGHFYCKVCLESWKETEKSRGETKWKCAMCNRKHTITS